MADREINPNSLEALKANQWKPGQSGNPLGGKLNNPELRKLRRLTSDEVVEIGTLILEENLVGIEALIEEAKNNPDSKTSALQVWMATIAVRGMKRGDPKALDFVLNRLIGKVADKMDLTGLNVPQVILRLPANGREATPVIETETKGPEVVAPE